MTKRKRLVTAYLVLALGLVIIASGPLLAWQAWVGLIAIISAAIITPTGDNP